MHSEKDDLIWEIDNSETIGISSGASAPEKLVQTLLNKIKKGRKVSIEEVVVAEEKVVFKLPKELINGCLYVTNHNKIEEILSNYDLGKLDQFKGIGIV